MGERRKKFFEDDREFVEQIINEKNEIGIIEEKTAKNEMANQRNLFLRSPNSSFSFSLPIIDFSSRY